MSVYIDSAFIPATVPNGSRSHTSKWCHMMADTTGELVDMASILKMSRSWIQYEGTPKEHFDLTQGKRWQAVRAGAVEITSREAVALMRAKREGTVFDLAALRAAETTPAPPSPPEDPDDF